MEDIANEVIRQLRVEDGDLKVWVNYLRWDVIQNKIQPTIHGGLLRWRWYDETYSMLFNDLDELMEFVESVQKGGRSLYDTRELNKFTIMCKNKTDPNKEDILFSCEPRWMQTRDRVKKFLDRCSKIELY